MSISGAVGGLLFKTFKRANGEVETRVYPNPYFKDRKGRYSAARRTPVSEDEQRKRAQFGTIAQAVALLQRNGDKRPRPVIWADVKKQIEEKQNEGTH